MEARAKRLLCHSYGNTTRGSIIKLISSEKYGVLLSDLHVATAGDSLTVLRAMSHTST